AGHGGTGGWVALWGHAPGGRAPHERPPRILDALDEVRLYNGAAVGEPRVGGGQIQRGDLHRAQRHRQIVRQRLGVEAKARYVVDDGLDADRLEDADRHEVARVHQRLAHARGAAEGALDVLRAPRVLVAAAIED